MHPHLPLTHQFLNHGVKQAGTVELEDDFEVEVLRVVPLLLVTTEGSFVFVDKVVSVALVDRVVVVEPPETKQEHAEEIRTKEL
jgi:hypothetical protein